MNPSRLIQSNQKRLIHHAQILVSEQQNPPFERSQPDLPLRINLLPFSDLVVPDQQLRSLQISPSIQSRDREVDDLFREVEKDDGGLSFQVASVGEDLFALEVELVVVSVNLGEKRKREREGERSDKYKVRGKEEGKSSEGKRTQSRKLTRRSLSFLILNIFR